MFILQTHIVPSGEYRIRLQEYAVGLFPQVPSRKSVKKAIKKGAIHINGTAATTATWIEAGQKIELLEIAPTIAKTYELTLDIVYEDAYLAVVNKPAGLVVSGNQFRTLQNALPYNLQASSLVDALPIPRPVHRLDAPTSGLLLVAKSAGARIELGKQLEYKKIQKQYRCVVIGTPPPKGTIDVAIEGKRAVTHYELRRTVPSLRNDSLSLLDVHLETGRTHQIRIHLSGLGFPIMGDQLYGQAGNVFKGKGLFLAAIALGFEHPGLGEWMELEIETPYKFEALMEREQRRWEKYQ